MAPSFLLALPFLLFQASLVSAVPSVTTIQVGQGNCAGFPNSYKNSGNDADAFVFHPDQADNPRINGLQTGIVGTSLVVYESNTTASAIFCCWRSAVKDAFFTQDLLLSPSPGDKELRYLTDGVKPETYAHEINGVRQDGIFLGISNVTTWAFRRTQAHPEYYQIRLAPGSGEPLYEGEFKGFLKVLPP
ncbi:hypothetical protein BGZ60DRAFT_387014 [Tricladium varicosporioides]|nr:hypothetical protein BGZ60DRAFT_387014 [Hymenoscyphus varicosporioides]